MLQAVSFPRRYSRRYPTSSKILRRTSCLIHQSRGYPLKPSRVPARAINARLSAFRDDTRRYTHGLTRGINSAGVLALAYSTRGNRYRSAYGRAEHGPIALGVVITTSGAPLAPASPAVLRCLFFAAFFQFVYARGPVRPHKTYGSSASNPSTGTVVLCLRESQPAQCRGDFADRLAGLQMWLSYPRSWWRRGDRRYHAGS